MAKRPVKKAATKVDIAATKAYSLMQKLEKNGIRVEVVQMLPRPIIDLKIKNS